MYQEKEIKVLTNKSIKTMWQIKTFKTLKAFEDWKARNAYRYQMVDIFINNGYGVEYRKLRRM